MSDPRTPHHVRPDWVRRLNQFGPATGGAEHVIPLDPDEMLEVARRSTGLHEVGEPDWLETYERRLRSIDAESDLTLVGRLLCRAETIRVLQTRLRMIAAWNETPAILEEKIERPLFIVGPPRTGTSILLELLALDPQLRAPIAWEAHHPLPHDGAPDEAAALERAEAEQELWADIQPELMTLHELRADLPCECVHFMSLDFGANYWSMHYVTPSYDAWAATKPDTIARGYREHRRFLQTLQYGRAQRRWLLKSPAHLAFIHEVVAEYPDAVFLQTHRDPLKFVGSTASTTAMIRWLRSEQLDAVVQGQIALGGFSFILNQIATLRKQGALPDEAFVDLTYVDLVGKPADTIRAIYDQIGLPWPEGHADAVESYLRDKPKGKFGKHEYTLEEYGLSDALVRETFAEYVSHYDVPSESAAPQES